MRKSERNKLIIQCAVIMEDTQCFNKGLTQQVHRISFDLNSSSNDKPYSLCL